MIDAPVPPEGEEEDGEEDDDTGGGFGGIGDIMFLLLMLLFRSGLFSCASRFRKECISDNSLKTLNFIPKNGAGCGKKPHKTKV